MDISNLIVAFAIGLFYILALVWIATIDIPNTTKTVGKHRQEDCDSPEEFSARAILERYAQEKHVLI